MATKPKVNAPTQAIRDQRAVAKAGGNKYTAPATKAERAKVKGVNAATQASRVARAGINKTAREATAKTEKNRQDAEAQTEMNRKAATDTEGNVGEYETVKGEVAARPKRYVKPAAPATDPQTVQIRKDRASFAAKGQRYVRANAGLSAQSLALRRNARVNERLLNLRASKREAARAAKASNG